MHTAIKYGGKPQILILDCKNKKRWRKGGVVRDVWRVPIVKFFVLACLKQQEFYLKRKSGLAEVRGWGGVPLWISQQCCQPSVKSTETSVFSLLKLDSSVIRNLAGKGVKSP